MTVHHVFFYSQTIPLALIFHTTSLNCHPSSIDQPLKSLTPTNTRPADPPTTPPSPPLPPGLKEISSLASWTVSSSKPGCSIPQLRNPSTALFWQSDGPQPHLLNIHFFKLVRIVGLRLYLDFEADESYTPTRIQFLAGSGPNDLQEWAELRLEQPRGWVWVGFEGVGEAEGASGPAFAQEDEEDEGDEDDDDEDDDYDDDDDDDDYDDDGASDSSGSAMVLDGAGGKSLRRQRRRQRRRRGARMPVLRAFLVQVKILENHQNGKDTDRKSTRLNSSHESTSRMPSSA